MSSCVTGAGTACTWIGEFDPKAFDIGGVNRRRSALEDITPQAARKWVSDLQKAGASASSLGRMIAFWRSYWRYLSSIEAVGPNSFPFSAAHIQKTKKAPEEVRAPFPADYVPKLWKAAHAAEDQDLANLIQLGAYTGGRIEELCSLKVADVNGVSFKIRDAKTEAGIREVPFTAP
jgi:site-specific recombinase XerD